MRILVSGATGLIGSALVRHLTAGGDEVTRLTRAQPRPGEAAIRWDPAAGTLEPADLEGFDAVIHLAGESIAGGRWTAAKKARIRESRVRGTGLLAECLARSTRPPRVLLSASAIGYYGNRGDEDIDEGSPPGSGFLPEVCRDWEAAAQPAEAAGIRLVHLRTGLVLSPAGGSLAKMLPPFRLGLGGRIGSGWQYVSWITLHDEVEAIRHAIVTDSLAGPVNLVAPGPVTNRELTRALGRVLRRPALLPVPAFALRIMLGEMAEALLLSGARVLPRRLLDTGFTFRDPELEGALARLLAGG